MCPVTRFFAVETNLSFWWDLEKFSQNVCPVTRFVRCGDYLKFWMGLRKVSTKMCAQLHVFAVQTISSFWLDLEKIRQKGATSHTFFSQCRLSWVFDGTWKVSTKSCDQLHGFNAVESNSSFWWDLEKFSQKSVPSRTVLRCRDYLKFLRGLGKFRQKGVTSYTFFRSADYLKFFDGTWKNFHKKVCPVTRFRSADYLKFLIGLRKISTKRCDQPHIFFAVQTILSFWWGSEKFPQNCVPSYTFFRCGD